MPIALTAYDDADLCHGSTWAVVDKDALAASIARVAMGQADHVAEVLAQTGLPGMATSKEAAIAALEMMQSGGDDNYHRDGWLFQVMSWIAAHRKQSGGLIRAPHMIFAHKGFDGIQILIDDLGQTVNAVVISEDKATENPRATIRTQVWPEFVELENGKRQNELVAEVAGLLRAAHHPNASQAIESIVWSKSRRYRTSITIESKHAGQAGRAGLFKGYETTVAGSYLRRQGEVFLVRDLRQWMNDLADRVSAQIKVLAHV